MAGIVAKEKFPDPSTNYSSFAPLVLNNSSNNRGLNIKSDLQFEC
jgi:hypothetical protein